MLCPKCKKGKFVELNFRYTNTAMCPHCHYYVNKKDLIYESLGISKQNCTHV